MTMIPENHGFHPTPLPLAEMRERARLASMYDSMARQVREGLIQEWFLEPGTLWTIIKHLRAYLGTRTFTISYERRIHYGDRPAHQILEPSVEVSHWTRSHCTLACERFPDSWGIYGWEGRETAQSPVDEVGLTLWYQHNGVLYDMHWNRMAINDWQSTLIVSTPEQLTITTSDHNSITTCELVVDLDESESAPKSEQAQ